jgi:hypothetical protein
MAVASALHRAGWEVFVPLFAAHSRIDLIACRDGVPSRIQVKSARRLGDTICFRTHSNTANRPAGYRGEIDAFGVYSPDLDTVYVVPIDEVADRGCTLRLEPTRNGQRAGIRMAEDYLLGRP